MEANAMLRGRVFYLSAYDRHRHPSGQRCRMCDGALAFSDGAAESLRYYATFVTINYSELPVHDFWIWLCPGCFAAFQDQMEWTLGPNPEPSDLDARRVEFTKAWNRRIRDRQLPCEAWAEKYPYARAGWNPEDIVGVARTQGISIDAEFAREFLEENEAVLLSAMDAAGVEAISNLLRRAFPSPDGA